MTTYRRSRLCDQCRQTFRAAPGERFCDACAAAIEAEVGARLARSSEEESRQQADVIFSRAARALASGNMNPKVR